GGSTVVLILLIFGGFMFTAQILDDYTTNVFTEALGVLATVLIVDLLNRKRAERERKDELIFQMGSTEHTTASGAARLLKHRGWLQDGSLRGHSLSRASLQRADLRGADLRNVRLRYTNMEGAYVDSADLRGTDLQHANLSGARLKDAMFDEGTVLPDARGMGRDERGEPIYDRYWTPDTDMTRYTDPNHPEFWQPEWIKDQGGDEAGS
ncbi:MAG: pentapeptide repeat-containing protein, partial [Chloroflexota bacterium]